MERPQPQQPEPLALMVDLFERHQRRQEWCILIYLGVLAEHQAAMEALALSMISRTGNWAQAAAAAHMPPAKRPARAAMARSQAAAAVAAQHLITALPAERAETAAMGG